MRHVCLAFMLLLWLAPSGQCAEPEDLSLQEALGRAYQHNPRVLEALQDAEAAKGQWKTLSAFGQGNAAAMQSDSVYNMSFGVSNKGSCDVDTFARAQ